MNSNSQKLYSMRVKKQFRNFEKNIEENNNTEHKHLFIYFEI